jgi:hypothetical protein
MTKINSTNLGTAFPINASRPVAPTGAIYSVNATFTSPTTPGPAVLVFLNGILQQGGGIDCTLSGSTLTFVSDPFAGSVIAAVY